MKTSISIEIDHRVDEHIKAERLRYSKCSHFANVDRIVAVILVLFGVFSVVTRGMRWWTLIWFVVAPLEYFNLLSITPLVIRYRFKRTPKFHERNELTFSEDGFYFKTPSIDSNLKWDIYTGMVEDDDIILLMYGGSSYSVIPKRVFKSEEDLKAFQTLVQRKIT